MLTNTVRVASLQFERRKLPIHIEIANKFRKGNTRNERMRGVSG